MAEDRHHEVRFDLPIKLNCASGLFFALALLAACQTVPANTRDQFLNVAQRLRAFPPDRVFFVGGDFSGFSGVPGMRPGTAAITPGTTEYQTLMQSNYPVPVLLSLLKDADPKIRTLAAGALLAKGDPRLQQHLGPLLEDQSQTFDEITIPMVDNFVPPSYTRQTVAFAALRLVEKRSKQEFDRYWASHANRAYCADWFLWQFRHAEFAPLARQQIQSVPSPDRELITLWIGTGHSFHYQGFPEAELISAAKSLGPERVLAVLRHQPPGTDPDIKPHVQFAMGTDEHYGEMARFLLAHAKDCLRRTDADVLLSMEIAEKSRTNSNDPTSNEPAYQEWWPIAAASLRPKSSGQILDDAEKRYPQRGNIPLARWRIQGRASVPKVLQSFYNSPQAQEQLALTIYLADPNDSYKPLVEAILASPDRLKINGEAMYYFAEPARKWKADFDRQFVDWIYAQPPDPNMGIMGPPRRLVVETSGVSKKLVRDSRFLSADSQLLYVIEQCLVGTKALSPPEYARLDRFVRNFNVNPPRNISETELKDVRKLLRKEVGK
jgi:nitroreductase